MDLAEERQAVGVDEVLAELDRQLVGLVPVKTKVDEIASLLMVDRVRRRFGLDAPRPNLHMCFTGEPGTGKTTVALKMADLLHRLGYLRRGRSCTPCATTWSASTSGRPRRRPGGCSRSDGRRAVHRRGLLPVPGPDRKDFGQECIDILLQVMENERDKLVVILAGYKDRMDVFFESNPGMSSRIAHHLDFAPYRRRAGGHRQGDAGPARPTTCPTKRRRPCASTWRCGCSEPRFANARSVRNELERARLRHAHRLASNRSRAGAWTT